MNIFIVLFILLINIVNIFAMYKLLGNDIGKKEKVIFIYDETKENIESKILKLFKQFLELENT